MILDDKINVQLYNEYYNTEENICTIHKLFSAIISKAIELKVWRDNIKEIVVTDEFRTEFKKQALAWNVPVKISQEKENSVASKILFNRNIADPKYKIFFHVQNLHDQNFPLFQIALSQILSISSKEIIPSNFQKYEYSDQLDSLDDYIKFACIDWCKAVNTRGTLNKLLKETLLPIDQNTFLNAFKRKLKKNLYDYNSHRDISTFWFNYFDSLYSLFLRISENTVTNNEIPISVNEPCRELIYNVVTEIIYLTNQCLSNEELNTNKLKEAVKTFSSHFEIFLEKETENDFNIRLTKNPKDYFTDLVETEQRMVCFMDILGFSEYINQYDSDITSTVLQDIKESFDLAKKHLLDHKTPQNEEVIRHLKYQTFSDNICISIPFFDNESDFLSNFNLLIAYVKGFQSIMMAKGFFTRGGISLGSYYADNNIIFSNGLVKAYLLESKKAIYPRIIIDEEIVQRLKQYDCKKIGAVALLHSILFDKEDIAFVNSIKLVDGVSEQLNAIFKPILTTDENDDDLFSQTIAKTMGTLSNVTNALLTNASNDELKTIEDLKMKVINNIIIYKENPSVLLKYEWLLELIKWIQKDETAKLEFQFLSDKLK